MAGERDRWIVCGLVLLLLALPLGALFHVDPRFPGSPVGVVVGTAAAILMLTPVAYVLVKRVPALGNRVTRVVPMRTLLALHLYAGVLGPLLALTHAAHKFHSPLGVALTGVMLVIAVSGYAGRYLLAQLARAARGRAADLAALQAALPLAPDAASARGIGAAIADVEFAIRAEGGVRNLFEHWLRVHIVTALVLYALLALHVWSGLTYGLAWL